LVKVENGNLLADSHSILKRQKNYFCQLLNVCRMNNVKQTEIRTAEPLVPEVVCLKVQVSVEKLKMYKLPGVDQFQQN
jgi:hypothetical protein